MRNDEGVVILVKLAISYDIIRFLDMCIHYEILTATQILALICKID